MRAQSELEIRILDMIEPVAKARGLDVVRVRVMGRGVPVLQIMAEKPDGTMDVEDCAKFSRALNPLLDEQDPIAGEYSLEVSSPGIDRPLTRVGDFANWIGHEVKIELGVPGPDGRKRFHGSILAEAGGEVVIDLKDGGQASLRVADMAKAQLVFTERLLQAARARGQAPAESAEDTIGDELGEDFDEVEVEDDEFEDDAELDDEAGLDDSDANDEDERT